MKRSPYLDDPIAYRIAYSRVAQKLHLASIPEEHRHRLLELLGLESRREVEAPDTITMVVTGLVGSKMPSHDLGKIEREALKLIERTRTELVELGMTTVGWGWGKAQEKRRFRDPLRLVDFLDQVLEPATVVLYFSARIENGHREAWLLDPPQPEFPPERTDGDLEDEAKGGDSPVWLRVYLGSLLNKGAQKDPPGWFGFQRRNTEPVNYRVSYNLACMYSRYGTSQRTKPSSTLTTVGDAALDKALGQLRLAIGEAHGRERKALTVWAGKDPALRPLREIPWQEKFEAALLAAAAGDSAKAV